MQGKKYWFRAKTHGWGWGMPLTWQGWLVYGLAFPLLVALFFIFPPKTHAAYFMASSWTIALLLVAVCWIKGEPPRRR
jgi:hypothetical protein